MVFWLVNRAGVQEVKVQAPPSAMAPPQTRRRIKWRELLLLLAVAAAVAAMMSTPLLGTPMPRAPRSSQARGGGVVSLHGSVIAGCEL